LYDEAAGSAGLRWISVDKPGYGHSDFQPRRTLLAYADDVAELAATLHLDRFVAVGESGGGPHALALARAIPQRVAGVILLASLGPMDRTSRRSLKPETRLLVTLARRAPWLARLPLSAMARQMTNPTRAHELLRRELAKAPEADRAVLEANPRLLKVAVAASADAFREGVKGAVQELSMLARPWGFDLREVLTRVELLHGSDDSNVPLPIARSMADALPNCSLRALNGAGHGLGLRYAEQIVQAVAQIGR
jgi:pimeloyl-ACP methyl ester carboxylesterase